MTATGGVPQINVMVATWQGAPAVTDQTVRGDDALVFKPMAFVVGVVENVLVLPRPTAMTEDAVNKGPTAAPGGIRHLHFVANLCGPRVDVLCGPVDIEGQEVAPPLNKPRLNGVGVLVKVGAMVTPELLCRAFEGEGVRQTVEEHEKAKSSAKRGARSLYVGVGEKGKQEVCKRPNNSDVSTHRRHEYSPRGLARSVNFDMVEKIVYLWRREAEVVQEGVLVQASFHVVQVAGPVRVRIPFFYGPFLHGSKDSQVEFILHLHFLEIHFLVFAFGAAAAFRAAARGVR